MDEKICEINLDEIRVSPFQPRRVFSEEELEELSLSIKAVGLIHPPVVRKIANGEKTLYYELIAGERRWRAAKQAGLSTLKVIVRDSNDEHAAKSTLIENVQRVNLNPIEMAEAFKRLITIFRMTQEDVSDKVGKKRSTVANYLRLLSLPVEIRDAISSGEITMGHAKAILSLENRDVQNQLFQQIKQKNFTVRDAEKACRKFSKKKKPPAKPAREQHLEELQQQLQEQLGTKVEIMNSKRGGKISLHYYSLEDLEGLIQKIIPEYSEV